METKYSTVLDFLAEHSAIEIPIWHRNFVWQEDNVAQFFSDLESLIFNPQIETHFLGIISHKPLSKNSSTMLIDGEQRLICVSLLILAISNIFGSDLYKKTFLFSKTENSLKVKIQFADISQDMYENLITNEDFMLLNNSAIVKAYTFLKTKILNSEYNLEHYFDALKRCQIIELKFDYIDNAQLAFDSINSTGVRLNIFEIIRNYVFMGLSEKEQLQIAKKYWAPFEEMFENKMDLFREFMISYILMQTDENITTENLHVAFNRFYNMKRKYKPANVVVAELFKFAQYFNRLKNADFSADISKVIEQITSLYDTPELYAFLFQITDDFQNKLIAKKTFIDMLELLENYLRTNKNEQNSIDFSKMNKVIANLLSQKYDEKRDDG